MAAVEIIYKNYKGITAYRRIVPISIRYGSSSWHPQSQWLLLAYDLDKKTDREFAMSGITLWRNYD